MGIKRDNLRRKRIEAAAKELDFGDICDIEEAFTEGALWADNNPKKVDSNLGCLLKARVTIRELEKKLEEATINITLLIRKNTGSLE